MKISPYVLKIFQQMRPFPSTSFDLDRGLILALLDLEVTEASPRGDMYTKGPESTINARIEAVP